MKKSNLKLYEGQKLLTYIFVFSCFVLLFFPKQKTYALSISLYEPYVYLNAYAGKKFSILASGQVLAPVFLSNEKIIYIDAQMLYGSHDYSLTSGIGMRQSTLIYNYLNVIGGYVLLDYAKTQDGHHLLEINPGIESLGKIWSFRLNSYIPITKTDWTTEGWANKFGNNNYIKFEGHNMYDAWFIYREEIGLGLDYQISRKIVEIHKVQIEANFGNYYYHMKYHKSILGSDIGLEIKPVSYLTISAKDTYDNYKKNTFVVGLSLNLNDLMSNTKLDYLPYKNNTVLNKLVSPIKRNFGQISEATPPVTGSPKNNSKPEKIIPPLSPQSSLWFGHNAPEEDNIWFFSGSDENANTSSDGSYEHPYPASSFDQMHLTHIYVYSNEHNKSYANIFLSSGAYENKTSTPLDLYSGQNIFGKTGGNKGFESAAQGNSRPLIIGSFTLTHKNNSLNNIQLQGSKDFKTGISIQNGSNITMNNVSMGEGGNYEVGLSLNGAKNVSIDNSEINAVSKEAKAIGIESKNSSLNIENNNSIVSKIEESVQATIVADGIVTYGSSVTEIKGNNNTILATTDDNINAKVNVAIGVGVISGELDVKGKNNKVSAYTKTEGSGTSCYDYGIYSSETDDAVKLQIKNATITSDTSGGTNEVSLIGIYINKNTQDVSISNTNVQVGLATRLSSEIIPSSIYELGIETTNIYSISIDNNLIHVEGDAGTNSWGVYGGTYGSATAGFQKKYQQLINATNTFEGGIVEADQTVN